MVVLFVEVVDTLASVDGFEREMASIIRREIDINASLDELTKVVKEEWTSRYNQLISTGSYRSLRSLARDVMMSIARKYSVIIGSREIRYWGDALANVFVSVARVYDDVEGALNELAGMGAQLFILTNLDNDIAKKILLKNGLLRFFKGVVSSDLTRVGKPNVKIFNAALNRAKSSRDESYVVSGLPEDIVGCRLAQLKLIFVMRKPVEFTTIRPDYVVNTLGEVPKLLQGIKGA